jgi:hypothetical protein
MKTGMLTVTLTAWTGVALTVFVRLGPFLFLSAFAAANLALRFSFRIWTEGYTLARGRLWDVSIMKGDSDWAKEIDRNLI